MTDDTVIMKKPLPTTIWVKQDGPQFWFQAQDWEMPANQLYRPTDKIKAKLDDYGAHYNGACDVAARIWFLNEVCLKHGYNPIFIGG